MVGALLIAAPAHAALDPSFGTGGSTVVPVNGPYGRFNDVAVIPTGPRAGQIVAVGGVGASDHTERHPLIAVFRPNGTLDPTFGQNGTVQGRLPGTIPASGEGGQILSAVAIDGGGKLVVSGYGSVAPSTDGVFVARYGVDGKLDTGADSDPAVAFGPSGTGFIGLAGAESWTDLGLIPSGAAAGAIMLSHYSAGQAQLTRISPAGSVVWSNTFFLGSDPSSTPADTTSFSTQLAVEPDGDTVVAGGSHGPPSDEPPPALDEYAWGIVRIKPGGAFDPGFGNGGGVTLDGGDVLGSFPISVAIDPHLRIVLSGYSPGGGVGPRDITRLARLNGDGSLDGDFGTGGRVSEVLDPSVVSFDIALDGSDIVGGGFSPAFDPANTAVSVFRYLEGGDLDQSFGTNGVDLLPQRPTQAVAVGIHGEGVLAAGRTGVANTDPDEAQPLIARFTQETGTGGGGSGGGGGGSGGVAGAAATSFRNVHVHKLVVPKSLEKLARLGVKVLASCDEDCRIVLEVRVSKGVANAMGLTGTLLARAWRDALKGERWWLRAKFNGDVRRALRSFAGGGHLQIDVTGVAR